MPISYFRGLIAALLSLSVTPAAVAQKQQPLPLNAMQSMATVFGAIRTDYVVPVDGDRLINSCMRGMFKELDSASAYLDAASVADLTSKRNTDLVGIGVELVQRAALPTVAAALEGSPAEKAGLRPRDYLLSINGESMEEADVDHAISRLKGKSGTEVVITIRRPGESAPRTLTLVREAVRPQPASAHRWPGDLGYLRLRAMNDTTPAELRAAVQALQRGGPLKGLVLDLRQSPGGLLQASVEVAAMFLPERAVIVKLEGRLPEANDILTADRAEVKRFAKAPRDAWPEALATLPLVVLMDGGTASGAEIIAAALRDHGRARLLGSKTFGRGSIQTVRMLGDSSAIKLTTAFFRTPKGQLLQNSGLLPDEPLADLDAPGVAGSDADPALPKARAMLAAR